MGGSRNQFIQARIWHYLTRYGPCRQPKLREALGLTPDSLTHVLRRMAEAGIVTGEGSMRQKLWSACGKEPIDERGQGSVGRGNSKNAAKVPRGTIPEPKPAIELERCWGWFGPVMVIGDD